MKNGKSEKLTFTDFVVLERWLLSCTELLGLKSSETMLFQYLTSRILGDGDLTFFVMLSSKGIRSDPFARYGGVISGWSMRNVQRVRRSLSKRNLIRYHVDLNQPWLPVSHLLNLRGIMEAWITFFSYLGVYPKGFKRLQSLLTVVEAVWKKSKFPVIPVFLDEVIMSKLTEQVASGFRQSADAMKRRNVKRMGKEVQVCYVVPLLKQFTKEFDEVFYEPGWTGREERSVKNWLSYCEKEGEDPREILFNVVKYWRRMRLEFMAQPKNFVHLPDTVSFSVFFKYRRQIGAWLAIHKDGPRRIERVRMQGEDSEVIDIDALSWEDD